VIEHGLPAVEHACTAVLSEGGCNDTIILKKLRPPVPRQEPDTFLWRLGCPPTDDCMAYNTVYLSASALSKEVSYAS